MALRGPLRTRLGIYALALSLAATPALARDAAFMDPGSAASSQVAEAIRVEPKNDIDAGETVVNVAKRVTIFFVNSATAPVHVDKINLNNDGNVTADITNDDCSKQGMLNPQNRCSVELSVTPTSPGPWSVEVLMTHNGAGRIARAKIAGRTSGTSDQKKDNGLTLANNKDSGTVNFGEVDIDGGKVVRSALMTNDSPDPLTVYAIDVIAAENGLTRLDQGCAVDMELKPGESCPVTLMWEPQTHGQISTDLIIRHSGRMGFAVIPIRGVAKGSDKNSDKGSGGGKSDKGADMTSAMAAAPSSRASIPMPPSASDIAHALKDTPAVSSDILASPAATPTVRNLRLIGTVGNRAVLIKPDGSTAVVNQGDTVDFGERSAKVTAIKSKSVDLTEGGKTKTLQLEAAQELVAKAAARTSKDSVGDMGKSDYSMSQLNNAVMPGSTPPVTSNGVATSPTMRGASVMPPNGAANGVGR